MNRDVPFMLCLLVILVAAALILGVVVCGGCSATGYRRESRNDVQAPTTQTARAGGNVTQNDPWTGRIAVAGLAAIPASFMFYLLAHRIKSIRGIMDRLKGIPCKTRDAGLCRPVDAIMELGHGEEEKMQASRAARALAKLNERAP